ncbi:MAG: AraC family transcriptional regulator, partial [Lachnospiraceae bacterium]|nr:AraC family transcriptional regulator [Lachnospiraceae bacterium]
MEWTASFKKAIDYMEENLLQDISAEETARKVNISSFYFQRGFKIMTGYSISEYIRNRRLYLAGLEVISGRVKVIDLAGKYGYDTPESFAKAFARFHGCSPMQLKEKPFQIKTFLPLTIEVIIRGGAKMEFQVEQRESVKMIGFETQCSFENSYQELPEFWAKIRREYCQGEPEGNPGKEEIMQIMKECAVGEYGVCIDDRKEGVCRYLIAGIYWGGNVPEGMKVVEIP